MVPTVTATLRQQRGAAAETAVAEHLAGRGWRVIARNVELGGVEIDILAVDPGPPATIVLVEVRSLHAAQFGAPEESVDAHKVSRLYRALAAIRDADGLLTDVDAGQRRVDLVIVDERAGQPVLRHLRALEPP
jgi:putative endonuclease